MAPSGESKVEMNADDRECAQNRNADDADAMDLPLVASRSHAPRGNASVRRSASRPAAAERRDAERPDVRSHAERGNESEDSAEIDTIFLASNPCYFLGIAILAARDSSCSVLPSSVVAVFSFSRV